MRIARHPYYAGHGFAQPPTSGTGGTKRYPEHAKPLNGYNGGYKNFGGGTSPSPVNGALSALSARPGSGAPSPSAITVPAKPAAPSAIPEPGTTLLIDA